MESTTGSPRQVELTDALEKWEECAIDCYTYLFSTMCDCPETDPIQVDVVTLSDGTVVSINIIMANFYSPVGILDRVMKSGI